MPTPIRGREAFAFPFLGKKYAYIRICGVAEVVIGRQCR